MSVFRITPTDCMQPYRAAKSAGVQSGAGTRLVSEFDQVERDCTRTRVSHEHVPVLQKAPYVNIGRMHGLGAVSDLSAGACPMLLASTLDHRHNPGICICQHASMTSCWQSIVAQGAERPDHLAHCAFGRRVLARWAADEECIHPACKQRSLQHEDAVARCAPGALLTHCQEQHQCKHARSCTRVSHFCLLASSKCALKLACKQHDAHLPASTVTVT